MAHDPWHYTTLRGYGLWLGTAVLAVNYVVWKQPPPSEVELAIRRIQERLVIQDAQLARAECLKMRREAGDAIQFRPDSPCFDI